MSDNTLSVCMIVKNEEKNLKRCLDSIKNIAEEIIIVDTGSTDKTIEIAKKYTKKIFNHKWNNNFSEARNISLKHATQKWILVLDADEFIAYEEGIKLKTILKENDKFEGFHLRLVNYVSNINIGDAIVLRVFKNNPNYIFSGRMHEQVVYSIGKHSLVSKIGSTDVKIYHYGYDPDEANMELKLKRNFELLNSYPEEDRDGYFYYSLANEYTRMKEYDSALEMYKKSEEYPIKEGEVPVYLSYLAENVCKTLYAAGRFKEQIDRLHDFQKKYEKFSNLYFLEFLAWSECCKYTKAKEALNKYLNCEDGNYEYPSGNFEKQYDIKDLINIINENSIEHSQKMLSVLVVIDRYDFTVLDTVKSINEIADQVILIGTTRAGIERESLENICVEVIEVKAKDRLELFLEGIKRCNCKYILLLRPSETIDNKNKSKLIGELESGNCNYMYLDVVNKGEDNITQEIRLILNNEDIRSFTKVNDYIEYLNLKNIKDINVEINKMYI